MANYKGSIRLTAKGLNAYAKNTKGFQEFYTAFKGLKGVNAKGLELEALAVLLYNRKLNGSLPFLGFNAKRGFFINGTYNFFSYAKRIPELNAKYEWVDYANSVKPSTISKWVEAIKKV